MVSHLRKLWSKAGPLHCGNFSVRSSLCSLHGFIKILIPTLGKNISFLSVRVLLLTNIVQEEIGWKASIEYLFKLLIKCVKKVYNKMFNNGLSSLAFSSVGNKIQINIHSSFHLEKLSLVYFWFFCLKQTQIVAYRCRCMFFEPRRNILYADLDTQKVFFP